MSKAQASVVIEEIKVTERVLGSTTQENIYKRFEVWKQIDGFPNYAVSTNGRVKSIKTGKTLHWTDRNNGYRTVGLSRVGKVYYRYIHRLVAEAFIHNSKRKEEVNHIDFNTSNNCVSNLEWCTRSENIDHSKKAGRLVRKRQGIHSKNCKITVCEKVGILDCIAKGCTNAQIAEFFKTNTQTVSKIRNGKM